MNIKLKDINSEIPLGNTGIILEVRDTDDSFLGKLRIGKGKIEWCRGKTPLGNGKTKTWEEFIDLMEK